MSQKPLRCHLGEMFSNIPLHSSAGFVFLYLALSYDFTWGMSVSSFRLRDQQRCGDWFTSGTCGGSLRGYSTSMD